MLCRKSNSARYLGRWTRETWWWVLDELDECTVGDPPDWAPELYRALGVACDMCQGTGEVENHPDNINVAGPRTVPCEDCEGSGVRNQEEAS